MEIFMEALLCPLFDGVEDAELQTLLTCLNARQERYTRGALALRAGSPAREVGVVLEGGVDILQEDFWGNRGILARVQPGELFAEAFCCAQVQSLPVAAQALEPTRILWLDYQRIITVCPDSCAFHQRLVANMLRGLARKNIHLTRKIEHVTRRSMRGKILAYLSDQALIQGGPDFIIPFNRQELADYLAVDRSALSAELARMADEGVLEYRRNHFVLLEYQDVTS